MESHGKRYWKTENQEKLRRKRKPSLASTSYSVFVSENVLTVISCRLHTSEAGWGQYVQSTAFRRSKAKCREKKTDRQASFWRWHPPAGVAKAGLPCEREFVLSPEAGSPQRLIRARWIWKKSASPPIAGWGFNRLTSGAQSFDDELLRTLGRIPHGGFPGMLCLGQTGRI